VRLASCMGAQQRLLDCEQQLRYHVPVYAAQTLVGEERSGPACERGMIEHALKQPKNQVVLRLDKIRVLLSLSGRPGHA
jgi:hypothetical protein